MPNKRTTTRKAKPSVKTSQQKSSPKTGAKKGGQKDSTKASKESGKKGEKVQRILKPFKPDPSLLLHPNIPKPLHCVNPRTVLGSSWWNKTRKEAYEATGHHCAACGVPKAKAMFRQWLEGHEYYDIDYSSGKVTYLRTVALCHACHNYIHDGRLENLLERGEITHHKYAAILKHGEKVLSKAGLKKPSRTEREKEILKKLGGEFVEWHRWRLVVNGKSYKPLFDSLEEYEKANQQEDE